MDENLVEDVDLTRNSLTPGFGAALFELSMEASEYQTVRNWFGMTTADQQATLPAIKAKIDEVDLLLRARMLQRPADAPSPPARSRLETRSFCCAIPHAGTRCTRSSTSRSAPRRRSSLRPSGGRCRSSSSTRSSSS